MTNKAKIWFCLLTMVVVGLWVFFPYAVTWRLPAGSAEDWSRRGTFGDSYGVFTSLFSALAFCGVAITLHLQSKQLSQLKDKEDDTATAQALQTRLMAATALLNAYNTEANLLQEKRDRLQEQIGWPQVLENDEYRRAINKARPIVKKRNEILAELEELMRKGLTAKSGDGGGTQSVAVENEPII